MKPGGTGIPKPVAGGGREGPVPGWAARGCEATRLALLSARRKIVPSRNLDFERSHRPFHKVVRSRREYKRPMERFPPDLNSVRRTPVSILDGVLIWILLNLVFAALVIWRRVIAVPARRLQSAELARLNDWRA